MNRKATHYGSLTIGETEVECVVLEGGERGYVQRQLAEMFGFTGKGEGPRYRRFLGEFCSNAPELLKEKGSPITLPSGQKAKFFPAGIIPKVALEVVLADAAGVLHKSRKHLVPYCTAIARAFAEVGEVALIDEATGYQDDRAPEFLQKLFELLLRDSAQVWQRRFDHDYYDALLGLWGREYDGHKTNPPQIIGQLTDKWVYKICFPEELCEELKNRKSPSEKMHQWLTDGGQTKLEGQILAVTAIARSSERYTDFDARCRTAFLNEPLQRTLL